MRNLPSGKNRSMRVTLVPDLQKYPHAWPMTWNLVEVWGTCAAPAGTQAAHWLLWTLRAGRDGGRGRGGGAENARSRWPIEEVHFVLKSGCKVEESPLGDLGQTGEGRKGRCGGGGADRVVARSGEENPEAPAMEVLSEDEVEVLVCRFGKGGMKPSELTIGQAVLWIGRLGGHLNRKRDGMPGVRTLWRGLHDLAFLAAGFRAGKRAARISCAVMLSPRKGGTNSAISTATVAGYS